MQRPFPSGDPHVHGHDACLLPRSMAEHRTRLEKPNTGHAAEEAQVRVIAACSAATLVKVWVPASATFEPDLVTAQ